MNNKEIPEVKYNNTPAPGDKLNLEWWNQPNPYQSIFQWIKVVNQNQSCRRIDFNNYQRMYMNRDVQQLFLLPGQQGNTSVSWNIIKSAVDTLTNRISKSKPRPIFLTEEGSWEKQEQAKQLTRFVDGIFQQAKVYEIGRQVFRDAGIQGTGAWRVFAEGETISCERVLMKEIVIDETDAKYGKPRQIHQIRTIARAVALDLYGDNEVKRYAIECVPRQLLDPQRLNVVSSNQSYTNDMIQIVESWHLSSSNDPLAGDGLHVISIETCTLMQEPYKKDYFPFVFYFWTEPLEGFYGTGVAEELFATQVDITKTLKNIQIAQHLIAVPRIYIQNGSNVVSQHINNTIGSIIKYTGSKPEFFTPQAMNAEVYDHLERMWNKGFEQVGLTQMSATGVKPTGLDAGIALRTYHDIETERFATVAQRWEEAFLELAKMFIDLADDLYTKNPDFSIKAYDKFLNTIKWADVKMNEADYTMRLFPTSMLPTQPEAKFQRVSEMIRDGMLDMETGKRLLEFPDIEAQLSLDRASDDLILQSIGEIVAGKEYNPPSEYMNLERALKYGQNSYLKYKVQKLPNERLELIDRWNNEIIYMIKKSMAGTPSNIPPTTVMPAPSPQPVLTPM